MFICFGKLSYSLIFPLIYCIGCFVRGYFFAPKTNVIWCQTLLCSLAELSMGFGILILHKFIKNKQTINRSTNIQSSNGFNIQANDIILNQKKKEYYQVLFKIFILALSNYIFCFIIFKIENINFKSEYGIKILGILYTFLIVGYSLKIHFGRHRIFSLIVIITCDLIFIGINFIEQNEETLSNPFTNHWVIIFIALVCDIYFSSKHLMDKIIMERNFVSPYHLLFIQGIFYLILNIIGMFIFSLFKCGGILKNRLCFDNNKGIFNFSAFMDELKEYPQLILFFFTTIIVELFVTLNNKYLEPTYRIVFDIFPAFLNFVISVFKGNANVFNIISMILFFICLLIGLVHNEIIIVKICAMDRDTKEAIKNRGEREYNVAWGEIESLYNLVGLNDEESNLTSEL